MSEHLFTLKVGGENVVVSYAHGSFHIGELALTLDELRDLHSKIGEVLWDASAGRFGDKADKWKAMKLPPGKESLET